MTAGRPAEIGRACSTTETTNTTEGGIAPQK
jgi:hypothetical protein